MLGTKIRVAVCDDSPVVASVTEQLLHQYKDATFDIDVFFTSERLLEALDKDYDFFILDIELPRLSGIEVAERIREQDHSVPIIFLTSFREYMEEVFRLLTFDYILKPLTSEQLYPVLDRVINYLEIGTSKFIFTYKKVVYTVPLKSLLYFEKNKRQVIIHTLSGEYELNMTTEELMNKLDDRFVQIHLSYIVNIHYIVEMNSKALVVGDEGGRKTELPISRKFKENARETILMKLSESM